MQQQKLDQKILFKKKYKIFCISFFCMHGHTFEEILIKIHFQINLPTLRLTPKSNFAEEHHNLITFPKIPSSITNVIIEWD